MIKPRFRVHEGGRLASYAVRLPEILSVQEMAERLEDISHIIGGLACGFYADEERTATTLRFVNYPRAKYGDRTPEKTRRTAIDIAQLFKGQIFMPDNMGNRLPPNRAIIGLRHGYEGQDVADPSEVLRAATSSGNPNVTHRNLSVISVSPGSIYTEPALELEFRNRQTLTDISRAAIEFGQERFSLEVPKYDRVFMIETPHCKDIDDTPYVIKTATAISQHTISPRI